MKLFRIVFGLFVALLLASVWRPATAHQMGISTDVQVLANAVATGVSGNISPTYRNVRDATQFALQYRATSNATVNYILDIGTSLDDVNYVFEPTLRISANVIGNGWHHAVLTLPVCTSFRPRVTDLATTQGATVDLIVGSK